MKALSQAFTDHQQTVMKEFMVFNTKSVFLPHIIGQALRQRAKHQCFVRNLCISLFDKGEMRIKEEHGQNGKIEIWINKS